MIFSHTETFHFKISIEIVHLFSCGSINNSRFVFMFFQISDNICFGNNSPFNFEKKIFSVKTVNIMKWFVHTKKFFYIFTNSRRSCCCKSQNLYLFSHSFDKFWNIQIAFSEIMSPLRDTMCFINSHKRNINTFHKIYKFFVYYSFGSKIHNFYFS